MPKLSSASVTSARLSQLDKNRLAQTAIPIATVSASFIEDLKGWYGYQENETIPDVVFSRAHYSMAVALAKTAWGNEMDPKKAWLIDPTNYVTAKDWQRIQLTEFVGKTIARHSLLKIIKDIIDTFGRSKLPILKSIEGPLLWVTEDAQQPILSLHIAVGNLLAAANRDVVQVITDPHVREEYLLYANKPSVTFCVFDDKTKTEFLEKAAILHIPVDPDRVVVTGSPIDPTILAARKHKAAWRRGALKICLTTGGLGTNKQEIASILDQVLPELRKKNPLCKVVVYAGTHIDIAELVHAKATAAQVKIGAFNDVTAGLRLLYHPQITDANELLLEYGLAWADGIISKPSGDMAYDAAAAGCFLLTLKEWGVWEENVRQVFEERGIARKLETEHMIEQLTALTKAQGVRGTSWVETAMNAAFALPSQFLKGSENILTTYRKVAAEKTKIT